MTIKAFLITFDNLILKIRYYILKWYTNLPILFKIKIEHLK